MQSDANSHSSNENFTLQLSRDCRLEDLDDLLGVSSSNERLFSEDRFKDPDEGSRTSSANDEEVHIDHEKIQEKIDFFSGSSCLEEVALRSLRLETRRLEILRRVVRRGEVDIFSETGMFNCSR